MQLPFLTPAQHEELAFIRTQQGDYEVDILVDAATYLQLEEHDIANLSELHTALSKVEGVALITSANGKLVLEQAKLGDKCIQVSGRPALNDVIVVAAYLNTGLDSYSLFGKTLVPLRVYSFEKIKTELGLAPKSKAFGK